MKRMVLVVFMINLFVFGCSPGPAPTTPQPVEDEENDQLAEEEDTEETGVRHPLTGLRTETVGEHPIVMAMINNHVNARPQTGLGRADIVFEILAEGEITRFAAFYHSQMEGTIGPVRSARPYYLDLAEGLDAVVAHAGGSTDAKERFTQPGYPSLDGIAGGGSYFWREDFRQAPHNLYTSSESLLQGVEDKGYHRGQSFPNLLFAGEGEELTNGDPAAQVTIVYGPLYEVGYMFDASAGTYTRVTQGEEQVDLETEVPLTMANILVIKAPHRILDEQGRRDIGVTGSGDGWLVQRGTAQEIEWRYEDGFPQPYADGELLPLIPGRTWINVIPEEAVVNFTE